MLPSHSAIAPLPNSHVNCASGPAGRLVHQAARPRLENSRFTRRPGAFDCIGDAGGAKSVSRLPP